MQVVIITTNYFLRQNQFNLQTNIKNSHIKWIVIELYCAWNWFTSNNTSVRNPSSKMYSPQGKRLNPLWNSLLIVSNIVYTRAPRAMSCVPFFWRQLLVCTCLRTSLKEKPPSEKYKLFISKKYGILINVNNT